jgi:hypothetical protein
MTSGCRAIYYKRRCRLTYFKKVIISLYNLTINFINLTTNLKIITRGLTSKKDCLTIEYNIIHYLKSIISFY